MPDQSQPRLSFVRLCAMVLAQADPYVGTSDVAPGAWQPGSGVAGKRPNRPWVRLGARAREALLVARMIRRAPAEFAKELWKQIAPTPLETVADDCVRPVLWDHAEYPGFAGTCFLIALWGKTYAVTARHVIEHTPPDNMCIPATLHHNRMELLRPDDVFWYNAGDYDHVADICVAVFGGKVEGAISPAVVELSTLRRGEEAVLLGYPKEGSHVRYVRDEGLVGPDGLPIHTWFDWCLHVIRARCDVAPTSVKLGSVYLDANHGLADMNGLSGSPVFVKRDGKLFVSGMLVRANPSLGHLLSADSIFATVARVASKDANAVRFVLDVVETSLATGRLTDPNSLGGQIVGELGGIVQGALGGDKELSRVVLDKWIRGRAPLGRLVLEHAPREGLRKFVGLDEYLVLEHILHGRD